MQFLVKIPQFLFVVIRMRIFTIDIIVFISSEIEKCWHNSNIIINYIQETALYCLCAWCYYIPLIYRWVLNLRRMCCAWLKPNVTQVVFEWISWICDYSMNSAMGFLSLYARNRKWRPILPQIAYVSNVHVSSRYTYDRTPILFLFSLIGWLNLPKLSFFLKGKEEKTSTFVNILAEITSLSSKFKWTTIFTK